MNKVLKEAAALAQVCMARRNKPYVRNRTKAVEDYKNRERLYLLEGHAEFLLSKQRVRIKETLSWDEEYRKDMRGVGSRCNKRKARLIAISFKQCRNRKYIYEC